MIASTESIWEVARFAGDGYDRAEVVAKVGWEPVGSWGRDGWDLGEWPYVMVYVRTYAVGVRPGDRFEVCENVEGDATVWTFETIEARNAHIDGLALASWRNRSESWVEGVRRVSDMPAKLRGPFSWARLDVEKAAS